MSSTDPNSTHSGRHLRLMEDPNDPLVALRQQDGGDENNLVEPKFLGICCGPASSCCCGCTLQFALKAFATIGLVFGVLGLMGSLVSVGLADVWTTIQSLIKCGLVFTFGILLWNAAGEVNPRLGRLSSYVLGGIYVIDVITVITAIIAISSSAFKAKVVDELRHEFIDSKHHEPTPEQMEAFDEIAKAIIGTLIGSSIAAIVLEGLLYLLVFYVIWSFTVRAKRGEYFVLAYGPHSLPTTAPPMINPQYGVYYPQVMPQGNPQQQPMMNYPQPSQYAYYPAQGPQVQLSDMQQQPQQNPAPQNQVPHQQQQQ